MFEQYTEPNKGVSADDTELRQRLASGANWFYWIAGLSVVNSVVNFVGGSWNFAVGLGITQVLDAISLAAEQEGAGGWIRAVLFVFSLIVAGLFFIFGALSYRQQTWAMIMGTVLYALDGAILLLAGDVLGIVIHALAIFFLIRGFTALRQIRQPLPA